MPPADLRELSRNRLLAGIHRAELSRFADLLSLRDFPPRAVVSEPGERITDIVFPVDALFSIVANTSEGAEIEAGTVGYEGVVNVAPFLGADSTMLRTVCQIPGTAYVADVDRLLRRADGALAAAVRRYALALITMASQGAACYRRHPIDQRAARWLLLVHDRIDRNPFELTHEFFGVMLGANRPSVTLAAAKLRADGAIDYTRGLLTIRDRARLEAATCTCYDVITSEFERVMHMGIRKAPSDSVPPAGTAVRRRGASARPRAESEASPSRPAASSS